MDGKDICYNTVTAELHTHLSCRRGLFTQLFLSCWIRQCGFTTWWMMVKMLSTMYACFYKLVHGRLVMVRGYIKAWDYISKLPFGVIHGQNGCLRWRCTKLLALKLAKRLIMHFLRCEGLVILKNVERRLLTIYDRTMANYSGISSYTILQTHFEGHALVKWSQSQSLDWTEWWWV
jgi:hypothetical protein